MSSEAITKNDLTNILNKIAVSPAGNLVGEDVNGDVSITRNITAGGNVEAAGGVFGDDVSVTGDVTATGDLYAGGKKVRGSTRVWSGGLHMTASHSVTWTDDGLWSSVSLVWSAYSGGAVQNYQFLVYTVPRAVIANHAGSGHTIFMGGSKYNPMGCKYVYISLDKVSGNDDNNATGTAASGVKYQNNYYVLREVWLNY